MALRSKAAACLTFAALLSAAELNIPVRHEHLRKGGEGTLGFDGDGLSFEESGKHADHSRRWKFDDIQQLELTPDSLRILTYDDVRWQLGRDREYRFDHLPKDMAARIYGLLAPKLDQRFIARVPDRRIDPLWSVPAKMLHGRSGSNGLLTVGADRIVFDCPKDSRTWRFSDIQAVTSESAFELTISSLTGETRIQLKQVLAEDRYNDLWRRISEANGLRTFHSSLENHHD